MPCPKSSPLDKNNSVDVDDEKKSEDSPYEKLMHSLHNDPKWLQEVNLGRRVGLYKFRCDLGCGNFSQVKLAVHQLTKERVAIKIISKNKLDDKMMRMLNQEISTMESIHHPNLIRLYEVVETYSKLFLVMEYASGGELYDKITINGKLEELAARNIFVQICSAVGHMHEKRIIHRDIKAENVFFSGPNRVKLGDFGLSAKVSERNQLLNTFCGSPPYAAPELFCDENYLGEPVDVWALGILLYFMVVGQMPFKGQNIPTLKNNIIAGVYKVPKHLSKECADLIEDLIQQDPTKRLTVSSILSSAWLKGVPLPSALDANQDYSLAPSNIKPSLDSSVGQYSDVEKTARERLSDLGITGQMLESQRCQGSRSHIIGSYRIIVHRVQKQLCSFMEVDGFLPLTDPNAIEKKQTDKQQTKKVDNKFQLSNILNKKSSNDDIFFNCWRRNAADDDELNAKELYDTKEKTERLSLGEMECVEKAKIVLLQNRASHSAKNAGINPKPEVVRSTTCTIL